MDAFKLEVRISSPWKKEVFKANGISLELFTIRNVKLLCKSLSFAATTPITVKSDVSSVTLIKLIKGLVNSGFSSSISNILISITKSAEPEAALVNGSKQFNVIFILYSAISS